MYLKVTMKSYINLPSYTQEVATKPFLLRSLPPFMGEVSAKLTKGALSLRGY